MVRYARLAFNHLNGNERAGLYCSARSQVSVGQISATERGAGEPWRRQRNLDQRHRVLADGEPSRPATV